MALDVAVTFSIAELWDLLKAENVVLLTREEVLQIALTDAGVTMSQLTVAGQKIQESAGVYTYIVRFTVNDNRKYEYKIDAVKGTILILARLGRRSTVRHSVGRYGCSRIWGAIRSVPPTICRAGGRWTFAMKKE